MRWLPSVLLASETALQTPVATLLPADTMCMHQMKPSDMQIADWIVSVTFAVVGNFSAGLSSCSCLP